MLNVFKIQLVNYGVDTPKWVWLCSTKLKKLSIYKVSGNILETINKQHQ